MCLRVWRESGVTFVTLQEVQTRFCTACVARLIPPGCLEVPGGAAAMCRMMAFVGTRPMLLADVVLWPDRSIIKQSFDARERLGDPALSLPGNLNGDGFGIGCDCQEHLYLLEILALD